MHYNQSTFNLSSTSNNTSKISDVYLTNLKNHMEYNDVAETQEAFTDISDTNPNAITGLVFNDGTNVYNLPDSIFFYNAMPSARPRIHSWAVKKFS